MAVIRLDDGREIGDYEKPYIVAEVNSSHNGNVETAKEMIRKAKEIGCDCVKFQSWSTESLYSASYYDANRIAKRIVSKFALSEDELLQVVQCCNEQKIAFSSTPYSEEEVDFLVERCNVPYIKIASMEINNLEFIRYIAKKGKPIVLSTGMADLEEIRKAVEVIESVGNKNLCLLHCISIYPPEINTINLNNIIGLREKFLSYPIGFSDHSIGLELSSAAVALGSAIIEKHFTLDKKKMGMDNNMAMEPDEFEQLVKQCHNVYSAMGSKERIVLDDELEQRTKMRRSVVATRDLEEGHIITEGDLSVKRPGDGIPPEEIRSLIGKKIKVKIKKDYVIRKDNINC